MTMKLPPLPAFSHKALRARVERDALLERAESAERAYAEVTKYCNEREGILRENAELRKDAERYRAYRAYFRDNDADLEIAHALALTDSDAEFDAIWDKEIDTALAKEKRR